MESIFNLPHSEESSDDSYSHVNLKHPNAAQDTKKEKPTFAGSKGIQTRSQLHTIFKRLFLNYFQTTDKISVEEVLKETEADGKKIKTAFNLLAGFGFFTQTSATTYIWSGLKGVGSHFNTFTLEMATERRMVKVARNTTNMTEKDFVNNDERHLTPEGYSAYRFLGYMLHNGGTLALSNFEDIQARDSSDPILDARGINDLYLCLHAIELSDKNDSDLVYAWKGPKNILESIPPDEAWFTKLLRDNGIEKANPLVVNSTAPKSGKDPQRMHQSQLKAGGFALLKAKTWSHVMKNLHIIIGRLPKHRSKPDDDEDEDEKARWIVDVNLGSSAKKVSRQHALIVYNFARGHFEVRCLSRCFPIRVDNTTCSYRDEPIKLKNRTLIVIGSEHITFYLPM